MERRVVPPGARRLTWLPPVSRSRKRPVMADVAKLAGVAPDHGLAGDQQSSLGHRGDAGQGPAAIDALGYRSNMAARTLAGGRSRVLGVISVESEFYGPSSVLFGIQAAARGRNTASSSSPCREATVEEMRAGLDHLRDAHAEGVIVIAPVHEAVDALDVIRPRFRSSSPRTPTAAFPSVSIDQVQERGWPPPTSWISVTRRSHHVQGPKGWLDAEARAEGWRQELRARKRHIPRALRGDWSPRSGYRAGELLAADPERHRDLRRQRPDGARRDPRPAAQPAERRSRTSALVGFDDTPESEFYARRSPRSAQDLDEVGRRVDLLLDMRPGGAERRSGSKPSLVVRYSSRHPLCVRAHDEPIRLRPGAVWIDTAGNPIQAHGGSSSTSTALLLVRREQGTHPTRQRDLALGHPLLLIDRPHIWTDRGADHPARRGRRPASPSTGAVGRPAAHHPNRRPEPSCVGSRSCTPTATAIDRARRRPHHRPVRCPHRASSRSG